MSTVQYQADAIGMSRATVQIYRRKLRDAGKRITVATLRAHRDRQTPGRKPDNERANRIRHMRDRQRMTWSAIGRRFGISGTRACAIYNQLNRGDL
jgi:hypothetical protein